MTTLHFRALGCPKNLVDAEVMLGALLSKGFVLTEDPSLAQVIIVNTCAFIEDAKKEAIDCILEMGQEKEKGRCKLLVVTGCLPQRYAEEIEELFPEVDLFVGAGEFYRIAELLEGWQQAQKVVVKRPSYLYDHDAPRHLITAPHMAFIKIAEGCFHPCSFCIIPQIRGPFRSRDLQSVVLEARSLLDRGVRELNLIAQDTTAYGRDIGTDLAALLEALAALQGPKWIRVLYAYPHTFPERVIAVMREHAAICNYLDLPIQHISDRILRSMRRAGEGAEIKGLIARLRQEIPGIALRTSLIAGYPGETEEEFQELLGFVREMEFEHLGVFAYSPEEGTRAAELPDRIPAEVAEARCHAIMEVQQTISRRRQGERIGERLQVLVEGVSQETPYLLQARSALQAPDIDGVVYINEGDVQAGDFCEVEITDAHDYDLVGHVVARDS